MNMSLRKDLCTNLPYLTHLTSDKIAKVRELLA
jgi:hypothetical protein